MERLQIVVLVHKCIISCDECNTNEEEMVAISALKMFWMLWNYVPLGSREEHLPLEKTMKHSHNICFFKLNLHAHQDPHSLIDNRPEH